MLLKNITPILYFIQEFKAPYERYNDGPKQCTVYKLMYILHGNCIVYYGNSKFCLKQGDFLYTPPNVTYTTDIFDDFKNINLYYNCIPQKLKMSEDREWSTFLLYNQHDTALPAVYFDDCPFFNTLFPITNTFHGERFIQHIKQEYTRGLLFSEDYISSLLKCLLIEIARTYGTTNTHYNSNTAETIIYYINNHIEDDINCHTIAQELGYHPNYLNAVIKSTYGISLHTYIANKKIEQARRLLENTMLSTTEIAYRLSYASASSFCKSFKKCTGITPSSFRKKQKLL